MDSNKLNNIFGPDSSKNNSTIFHSIADFDIDGIWDRIFKYSDYKDFQHIFLLKNNDGDTCLHTAVKARSGIDADDMIARMVHMGAELNAQDSNGDTVVHLAVKKKDHELLEGLLDMDIDLNIKNKDELTAYQIAEQNNDKETLEIFSIAAKQRSADQAKIRHDS